MKCKGCGCNLPNDVKFCLRCGYNNDDNATEIKNIIEDSIVENKFLKDSNSEIKKIEVWRTISFVLGIILIAMGIAYILMFDNVKNEATLKDSVDDFCPSIKNSIKDIFVDNENNNLVLTNTGNIYYYILKENEKTQCIQIKELSNVKNVIANLSDLSIEFNNEKIEYYKLFIFNNRYSIEKNNKHVVDNYINKNHTFYEYGDYNISVDKDNNVYNNSKKVIDGSVFEGTLKTFNCTNSKKNGIVLKTEKYIYYFNNSYKLVEKSLKFKQFYPNEVKLLNKVSYSNKYYFVINTGDVYETNYIYKGDSAALQKSNDNNMLILIYIGVSCVGFIILATISYLGKNKTFGEAYKKLFILMVIILVILLTLNFLYTPISIMANPLNYVKPLISLFLTPLIVDIFYTINKKIAWYIMNSINSKKVLLFYVIYFFSCFFINMLFMILLQLFKII